MQRSARAGLALGPFLAVAVACGEPRAPRAGAADVRRPGDPWPACPRDAAPDATGHCVCAEGTLPLLGACVPPSIGDAYCGPAARLGSDGCTFKRCNPGQSLDVTTGQCNAGGIDTGLPTAGPCTGDAALVVENGARVCAPADAVCPRGSRRSGEACVRGLRCPVGSLPEGDGCRAVVLSGGRSAGSRRRTVDVGAWAAVAIGIDGGPGSGDICRPLEQEAHVLDGATPANGAPIGLHVALAFPDQDVSRMVAQVEAHDAQGQ
ncbi:MAG: hypothetical protein FWD17_03785, partial [Polyangiaceae bacterium]|nr:hypothetical protein [Polyangiaceae bacterium]